jgi:hypothetical protein
MVFDAYKAQRGSVMAGAAEKAKLGADVQLSVKQNNDWRIVHGLEAGAVISCVEALPQHLRALTLICFGPYTRDELSTDREWLHTALVRAMVRRRLPGQGSGDYPSTEAWRTLTALAWAAIYHHGEATYPYNRQGLVGPRAISAWLEEEQGTTIDTRDWTRGDRTTWGQIWRLMLTILDDWESQALGPVAELIPRAA